MISWDDIGQQEGPGPVGIGGWLIIPILGFFGTIYLSGRNLLDAVAQVDELTAILKAPGTDALADAKIPIVLSLVCGLLLIGTAFMCLVYILTKKLAIVKVATVHYFLMAAAGVVDVWCDS